MMVTRYQMFPLRPSRTRRNSIIRGPLAGTAGEESDGKRRHSRGAYAARWCQSGVKKAGCFS
jgi:hypothetical protein